MVPRMSKGYHIWTIGCQMNEADSRHLGSQLEALGYQEFDKPDDAEIVVLNTCVVRQQAEDKAVGKLTHMKKFKAKNPEMIVGLMGCMVGMRESKRLQKQFPFVDVFMPPSDTRPLMEFLGDNQLDQITKNEETRDKAVHNAVQDEDYILPALQRSKTVIANVPIVLGCSHACTFCIIPYRRGAERSKTREEILREVQKLTEQGVREVMLLGQIVDRYGCDFEHDYDLADLLVDVAGNENLLRVRFLTSHPNWMTDKLIDTVAQHPKLCPHFEVPVQAGNDEVLENMKREYTVEDFRQLGVDVQVATDDGSAGYHGLVTELIRPAIAASAVGIQGGKSRIVCCGPKKMMEATAKIAREMGVPCQVSLEERMACGIGVCFSCVAKIRDGTGGWEYRRTCLEGPVFDAEEVEF